VVGLLVAFATVTFGCTLKFGIDPERAGPVIPNAAAEQLVGKVFVNVTWREVIVIGTLYGFVKDICNA
jgi:hypothetical protein